MALYHFTVKNDSRPAFHKGGEKKGARISAALHSDYINREGQYKNQDALDADRLANVITSEKVPDAFYGLTTKMYASPYGEIFNTDKGIAITDKPSEDTIAVALMVAHATMNAPLIIKGSERFKARCIQAAADANLPLTFADTAMQAVFERTKEKMLDEQRRFRAEGGSLVGRNQGVHEPDLNGNRKKLSQVATQRTIPTMRELSAGKLVPVQSRDASVFLQEHERGELGHGGTEPDATLRWSVRYGGRPTHPDAEGESACGAVWADYRTGRRARARRTARALTQALREAAIKSPAQNGQEISVEGNCLIATASPLAGGFPATLIAGAAGTVRNTQAGLAVSADATLDTIATALMAAKGDNTAPLKITGTTDFKAECVLAARYADLPVVFADPAMQAALKREQDAETEERARFLAAGGVILPHGTHKAEPVPPLVQNALSATPALSKVPPLSSIPILQEGTDEEREAALLWMVEHATHRKVRPDFTAGRRERAEKTSTAILEALEDNLEDVRAAKHVEYINRHRAFEKKGGCVYQKHRLPPWAHDNPFEFFKAADKYSKQARRYKEFEFALQNELTLEQNLEIIDEFIKENLPDHYYAYAVHDKIGTISGASHNLHVHLMVSPKLIDDIERKNPRGKMAYFDEPLRKTAKGYQDEKARRAKGAPVDRKFSERWFIPQARQSYADITNRVLAKYGRRARVDHRSLAAQKLEAEMNGDKVLAAIFDRIPEKHIAQMAMLEEANPRVANVRDYRAKKNRYRDLLFQADLMQRRLDEEDGREKSSALDTTVHDMVESAAYQESDNDQSSHIGMLRENFAQALSEYETLKGLLVSSEDAYNSAKREYMDDDEEETFDSYLHLQKELAHWQEFRENLVRPAVFENEDERLAFDDLYRALDEKEALIRELLQKTEPKVKAIEEKLNNPDIKKQIQLIANRELQANKHQQAALKKAEDNLVIAITALEQALTLDETQARLQDTFSTGELYAIARRRYYGYKKEAERLQAKVDALKKKIISPDRARAMAEDKYTKKGFSNLRKEERELHKDEQYLEENKAKYATLAAKFKKYKREDNPAEYEEIKNMLAEMRVGIERNEADVMATRQALAVKRQDLEKTIALPAAQKKIHSITLAILRSHSREQKQYDRAVTQLTAVMRKLKVAQAQMNAMQAAYKKDTGGRYRYRVEKDRLPKSMPMTKDFDRPGFIMRAIMGDEPAAVAVGRMDNGDGTSKIWALMTDLAKEEEYNKNFSKNM